MIVDTGRRVEVESPACEREGENRLTALAQDRLCSGVSRSLAVSAPDLGVMGGHHRQQRRSSALPQRGGASLEGEGLFPEAPPPSRRCPSSSIFTLRHSRSSFSVSG